ncbi:MAG: hypothetical protein QXV82_08895 [Ignisphaera sp.]
MIYKLLEEVEEKEVEELKEMFDEVVDLTRNNPDFSILMLRKKNIVIFHCVGGYLCKTVAINFNTSDDAETFSKITKEFTRHFGGLAFDVESYVNFVKNSFELEVVGLNE